MENSAFEKRLMAAVVRRPRVISLPESADQRVTEAAASLLQNGYVRAVCLSDPGSVESRNRTRANFSPDHDQSILFIQELFQEHRDSLSEHVKQMLEKKKRVISNSDLAKKLDSPLWQSGWLLKQGLCDSVLAGVNTPTSEVIRAALGTVGLARGCRTVSGSFFMSHQDTVMLFADCGVVIRPDSEQLADIASQTVCTWKNLMGDSSEPVVGFLSFSSKGSAHHTEVSKMAQACRLFKEKNPDILADGELQFDAAYLEDVGHKKIPTSPIPGKTNIFIFPDLNSGNIGYKIAQRLGGYDAYGPILQGTSKVYSDLSRGASVKEIVISAMINSIRS